jgi:signal transduction histidine kinase
MAASIAHEINQPLAAVVNNANAALRWLSHQPPNIDEVQKALKRIAKDGERGSGIIESIRTLLKKGDRKKAKLDLNELIFDVATLARGQLASHGVTVRTELADDLPILMGDPVQIQQVMLNLLMNAAEATAAAPNHDRLVRVRSAILHNQARRHGDGTFHLPLDCRVARRAHNGGQCGSAWSSLQHHSAGRSSAVNAMKKQPAVESIVFVVDDDASFRDSLKSLFSIGRLACRIVDFGDRSREHLVARGHHAAPWNLVPDPRPE